MVHGHGELRLVAEQGKVGETALVDGIGRDHQVQVAAHQGGQRLEVKSTGDVQFHLGPILAVGVDRRQQPFEAAVALDGHVEPSGLAAGQPGEIQGSGLDQGQHLVGELQQALAGRGEAHRSRLADEQRAAEPLLQVLELMRQGRLGQVDAFRGLDQGSGAAQRGHGPQVP